MQLKDILNCKEKIRNKIYFQKPLTQSIVPYSSLPKKINERLDKVRRESVPYNSLIHPHYPLQEKDFH